MKPILVLQHVPHETLGTIQTALTDAGLACRCVELFREVPERLDLDAAAGMVVLGGPMNVDQTDEFPFLAPEIGWIQEAIRRELPVLGVCLGSQLLAKALGANVFAAPVKEIGWYPLELTAAAAGDRLFAGCGRSTTVFQWHGDTFELPAQSSKEMGAVQLARSEACENQAFCFGDRVYALQFHIEVTARMIDQWLDEPGNRRELAGLDYVDSEAIRRQTPHELPAMTAVGQRVFGRFAAMCRGES